MHVQIVGSARYTHRVLPLSDIFVKPPCGSFSNDTFCAGVVTDLVLKPDDAIMCSGVSGRPAHAAAATDSPRAAAIDLNDFTSVDIHAVGVGGVPRIAPIEVGHRRGRI